MYCLCVNVYCHRVSTQLQLNIYHIIYDIISYIYQTSSNSSMVAAGSSNGVTNTRCCRYSCLRSWWWMDVDCVWNVKAHAQKPDFVLWRNGRVYLNRRGRQFSRLLAGELWTSVCRVCTARASLCSAVTWRLPVTHFILLFLLHFSSRASPCAITFQLDSTTRNM